MIDKIRLGNEEILSRWIYNNRNHLRYSMVSPSDVLGFIASNYSMEKYSIVNYSSVNESQQEWHLCFSDHFNFIKNEYYKLYKRKIYHFDELEEAKDHLDSFLLKISKLLAFI